MGSNASLTISSGVTLTVNGNLTGGGTIVVESGSRGVAGGTLAAGNAQFEDNAGNIVIDIKEFAEATLPENYTSNGAITIASDGELTVSGTLTVNRSVEIKEGATLTSNVNVIGAALPMPVQ